jgi:hypothetical protein
MEKFELQKEKEPLVQLMPTAALEYLKEHNVFVDMDGNNPASKVFNELTLSDGEKCIEIHPLFNTSVPEAFKDRIKAPGLSPKIDEVKKYVQWKKGELPDVDKDEAKDIVVGGPYNHGAWLAGNVSGMQNSLLSFRYLTQKPGRNFVASRILEAGGEVIHSFPQKIMIEADVEGKILPDFEKAYLEAVENFIAIIPRLLTLLAREPKWDISEMEKYVEDKHIENFNTLPPIFSPEYEDLRKKAMEGIENINAEDMKKIEDTMRLYADVYGAIREYLESKVRYKDEENKK